MFLKLFCCILCCDVLIYLNLFSNKIKHKKQARTTKPHSCFRFLCKLQVETELLHIVTLHHTCCGDSLWLIFVFHIFVWLTESWSFCVCFLCISIESPYLPLSPVCSQALSTNPYKRRAQQPSVLLYPQPQNLGGWERRISIQFVLGKLSKTFP